MWTRAARREGGNDEAGEESGCARIAPVEEGFRARDGARSVRVDLCGRPGCILPLYAEARPGLGKPARDASVPGRMVRPARSRSGAHRSADGKGISASYRAATDRYAFWRGNFPRYV